MNHNMQMKKETGKILHRKFLSENIGLLLIAPVFLLLMFIVSNFISASGRICLLSNKHISDTLGDRFVYAVRGVLEESRAIRKRKQRNAGKQFRREQTMGRITGKAGLFCIVGTSD